jgi:hypothetical protein
MKAFVDRIRAEFRLAGMKLNAAAALAAGAIVANSAQFQAAVTSLVPARYQGLAGLAAGTIVYLIVRIAAKRDEKKLAGQ